MMRIGDRCAATATLVAAFLLCSACDEAEKSGSTPAASSAKAPRRVAPPQPVPVTRPQVILSHDLFARRWQDDGLAAVAKGKCWDRAKEAPASATFFVVVAPDGSVRDVQPEGLIPRPGNDSLVALHDCLAEMIRGMRFASGPGARSLVQVNRD